MTEKDKITDGRCGFELKLDDVGLLMGDTQAANRSWWHEREEAVCCWRKTWRNNDRCVWHAEVDDKPIKELKLSRADGPERLDGAYLNNVVADDSFSFRGCSLRYADFSNGDFPIAQFDDADLFRTDFYCADLYGTQFNDTLISFANFRNVDLRGAVFRDADITSVDFHDAYLVDTHFHDAVLSGTKFHDANLGYAEFHKAVFNIVECHDANLSHTKFHNADLGSSQFHNANLRYAEFNDADVNNAEFKEANLTKADYTDANATDVDFTHSILHDTLFTRADCRGATFTSALLYETVFADTRINSQTTFYNPELTYYNSILSRPACVYEENPLTSEDLPNDIHPLEAAEWVYRRLEKLHEENALSEDVRDFHISKEEVQRKYQREPGEYARCAVSTLQWHVTGHGESIPRIFRSAAVLILGCGILYPFAGGFESSSTGAVYRLHPFSVELSRAAIGDTIATILQSIYFSVITFTTIGYGDLYPTGAWSKVLIGFESLSGAILIALFVFVLGRRVAR